MYLLVCLLLSVFSHSGLSIKPKEIYYSDLQRVVGHSAWKCNTGDGHLHPVNNLTLCVFKNRTHHINTTVSSDVANFFNEIVRIARNQEIRHKRQTAFIRSEMRSLTEAQWNQFVSRLNELKRNGVYDQIVRFHGRNAFLSAHNGENFLGWHRVLLLWLEYYLGVPIPYFDSTLDFHMSDPRNSIVWSEFYVGNANDVVVTGPFAFWTAINNRPLTRRIGRDGTLMARENVRSILRRASNEELVHHPFSLEEYHNGLHVYVGGHMTSIEAAPSDPVFFLHHCFIDKLWADAQRNMLDPEHYPYNGQNPEHHPNDPMVSFPSDPRNPLRNRDGYRSWIANLARYAPSPSEGNCFNPTRGVPVLVQDGQGNCISAENPNPQSNVFAASFNVGAASTGMLNPEQSMQGLDTFFQSDLQDTRVVQNRQTPTASSRLGGLFQRQSLNRSPALSQIHNLQSVARSRRIFPQQPRPLAHPMSQFFVG